MLGALSGLSESQLQGYLAEMRRIAALDDTPALTELDAFAWSLSEAIAAAGDAADSGDWLGQSSEERAARFRQEMASARSALTPPAAIRPFDGQHLRQSAAIYCDDKEARREALTLADELDVAYAGAELERALRVQVASAAGLPKQFRLIDAALETLRQHGRLAAEHEQRARAARERLARWRPQRKLDEADVAAAGENSKKAEKLRREAAAVLAQDWPRTFPGETAPAL